MKRTYMGGKILSPRPDKELLERFLNEYDYLSSISRVGLYQTIIEKPEVISQVSERVHSLLDIPNLTFTVKSLINRIKSDTHFTAYHSTETLFALIFSFILDHELPWFWMTTYKPLEFSKLISEFANKAFSLFYPDGKPDDRLVTKALFFNVAEGELDEAVENSITYALDYLRQLAKEFQNRKDYNSYKHGLRTLAATRTVAELKALDGSGNVIKWDELTTTYLEALKTIDEGGQVTSRLEVVTKAIDYEKSIRIITANTQLMHNLLEIRKAQAFGKQEIDIKLYDKEHNAFDILKRTKLGMSFNEIRERVGDRALTNYENRDSVSQSNSND